MKRATYTVFGRRTDYNYAYDLRNFGTLAEAVAWKNDFVAGHVTSPDGYPAHDKSTFHIMDNANEYEVDDRGERVVYNDWLTGRPIL